MCCKNSANDQLSAWKTFLLHLADWEKIHSLLWFWLENTLPKYYKECLECLVECSGAKQRNYSPSYKDISETVIWNNRFICIPVKSVYNKHLVSKGIIGNGDLIIIAENWFITNNNLNASALSPLDDFGINAITDAIPWKRREILKTKSIEDKLEFVLQDEIYVRLLDIRTPISELLLRASLPMLNLKCQQHQQPNKDIQIYLVNIL